MKTESIRVTGRPIRGFFGGLFLGLGIAILAHAFNVVTFEDPMFTYFPVAVAVLGAIRGVIGSFYTVKYEEAAAETAVVETAPPAEPVVVAEVPPEPPQETPPEVPPEA